MDKETVETLKKLIDSNQRNTDIMFIMAGLGLCLTAYSVIRMKKVMIALVKNQTYLEEIIDSEIIKNHKKDMDE